MGVGLIQLYGGTSKQQCWDFGVSQVGGAVLVSDGHSIDDVGVCVAEDAIQGDKGRCVSGDNNGRPSMRNFGRWFIRSCFMLPIFLCVFGWVWSMGHLNSLSYGSNNFYVSCDSFHGRVYLVGIHPRFAFEEGWTWRVMDDKSFLPLGHWYDVLCFEFQKYINGGNWRLNVGLPYWFLIVLAALALFYVWRKTRAKVTAITFPEKVKGGSE